MGGKLRCYQTGDLKLTWIVKFNIIKHFSPFLKGESFKLWIWKKEKVVTFFKKCTRLTSSWDQSNNQGFSLSTIFFQLVLIRFFLRLPVERCTKRRCNPKFANSIKISIFRTVGNCDICHFIQIFKKTFEKLSCRHNRLHLKYAWTKSRSWQFQQGKIHTSMLLNNYCTITCSWHQKKTNPPIHEFKVLHKGQRAFETLF